MMNNLEELIVSGKSSWAKLLDNANPEVLGEAMDKFLAKSEMTLLGSEGDYQPDIEGLMETLKPFVNDVKFLGNIGDCAQECYEKCRSEWDGTKEYTVCWWACTPGCVIG